MAFSTFQVPTATELNDLILASYQNEQLADTPTTASTTFVTIGTTCGTLFVAPASGNMRFQWFCELKNSGANLARCTIYVKTGSTVNAGSDVLPAADTLPQAVSDGTQLVASSSFHQISGLTPGASYNVTLYVRCNAGTMTAGRRGVIASQIA